MSKRPDSQASSATHALIKGFSGLIGDMAIGWGLCFPDGDLGSKALPTSIDSNQIIDQLGVLHIDKALEFLFILLKNKIHIDRALDAGCIISLKPNYLEI